MLSTLVQRTIDCDTDHYLVVATIRERLSLKKGIKQQVQLNKLVDRGTRKEYQIDVANNFSAFESLEVSSVDDI